MQKMLGSSLAFVAYAVVCFTPDDRYCRPKTVKEANSWKGITMDSSSVEQFLAHGIHALAGGKGSLVVLLPGWPETAEAYCDIFPLLAARHQLLVLDPPGLGDSAPSPDGYDTARISTMLADAVQGATDGAYHLVGHDVGAWIAYAWAAQFPERLKSLTLMDSAVPGSSAASTFPLPYEMNVKLWQFSFNTLPDLPEILTRGRERELLDWLFEHKSQHPERISLANRDRYVECYSREGAMSNGFAYYRAAAQSAAQNAEFSRSKLIMPVLALGGEIAGGDSLRQSMKALAHSVEGGVVPDCGHFLMEEQPEVIAGELLRFFEKVDGTRS